MSQLPSPTARRVCRRLTAAALLTLLGTAACVSTAHDWTSPAAPIQPGPVPGPAPWSAVLWPGPASGEPAAPEAQNCDRDPALIDLPGPGPDPQQAARRGKLLHGSAAALRESRREHLKDAEPLARPSPESAAAPAAPGMPAVDAMASAEVSRNDKLERAESAGAPGHRRGDNTRPRQQTEPVTAGVVDDNADFGAYLAFTSRTASLHPHPRDVSERYLLTVHDTRGQPVPDARVTLHAGGQARPLWARTDAGGQVWLHPRVAGITESVLEVQVSRASGDGLLQGTALLRRGQRDQLQVTLDGGLPTTRARLDLVFLVDATGSMADEIQKLRSSMQAMADQIAQLPSRPQTCFALVSYRDRGDAFFVRAHDFSNRLDAFQQVLSGLQAGGGGDYPEAVNEALHTAVHRLSWRGDGATRLVVLLGDAPPHRQTRSPAYDNDMQGALARGIKLFTVGASGLDRFGEAVWRQLAQYTGGRFVFLTYAQARNPASGPGRETVHDVNNYSVQTLDKLVVRLVSDELARRPGG